MLWKTNLKRNQSHKFSSHRDMAKIQMSTMLRSSFETDEGWHSGCLDTCPHSLLSPDWRIPLSVTVRHIKSLHLSETKNFVRKCNVYQVREALMMSVYLYCVHSPLEAKIIPVFALQTLPGNLYPHQVNMNTKFSHHTYSQIVSHSHAYDLVTAPSTKLDFPFLD